MSPDGRARIVCITPLLSLLIVMLSYVETDMPRNINIVIRSVFNSRLTVLRLALMNDII